jgi:hypothetical protein
MQGGSLRFSPIVINLYPVIIQKSASQIMSCTPAIVICSSLVVLGSMVDIVILCALIDLS